VGGSSSIKIASLKRCSPLLCFSIGAGTACTKHLSRLSRRLSDGVKLWLHVLETFLCPHAGPFKVRAHGLGTVSSYAADSGEGQSSHPSLLEIFVCSRRRSPLPVLPWRSSPGLWSLWAAPEGRPSKELWETRFTRFP
jgi:hypothetical protein